MTGINTRQFRDLIVTPALEIIGLQSRAAENLVLGTAITESRIGYLAQVRGPALGIYQIEPATYRDLRRWLEVPRRSDLRTRVDSLADSHPETPDLVGNLWYATAMCRIFYWRIPAALPDADDARGLAEYWKRYYNTHLGKGTVEKATPAFELAINT